jgi:hypothetical protein
VSALCFAGELAVKALNAPHDDPWFFFAVTGKY